MQCEICGSFLAILSRLIEFGAPVTLRGGARNSRRILRLDKVKYDVSIRNPDFRRENLRK
jgi:hypothetical protein